MKDEHVGKVVLGGIVLLMLLIVGGLVWAIAAGPGPGYGSAEANLHFTDDNDPVKGPADAKVVLHIFGDFECPACQQAEAGLRYAMKTYADKVKFVWNDFPLVSVHPNALQASNAARCAEEQGKFWEYHDSLYDHQQEWGEVKDPTGLLTKYATDLGLQADTFQSCLSGRRYSLKVQNDMDEGNANSVRVTPTFFLGNVRLEGGMSNAEWDTQIQSQLQGS